MSQGIIRITHVEEVFLWLIDAILHHPFNARGIQITGHHLLLLLLFRIPGILVGIGVPPRSKSEFLFHLPLDFHLLHPVDEERQFEMKPWRFCFYMTPEAQDHTFLIRLHRIKGGQ